MNEDYARILRMLADAIDRGEMRGDALEVRIDHEIIETTRSHEYARRLENSGRSAGTVIVTIVGPMTFVRRVQREALHPPLPMLPP